MTNSPNSSTSSANLGELSRSSSTSKVRSMGNMNPGVQAKLLAFQAKRQQQIKQSKITETNNSELTSEINQSEVISTTSPLDHHESCSIEESISPLISKVQYHSNIASNSPLTPLSLDSSTFSSPIVSPNDDKDKNPLSRRTSFRIGAGRCSNSSASADDDIVRRTSFRLNSGSSTNSAIPTTTATTSSDISDDYIESDNDNERRKSIPNINTVNKNIISKIQKRQSTPTSSSLNSSTNSIPIQQSSSSSSSASCSDGSSDGETITSSTLSNKRNITPSLDQSEKPKSSEKLSLSQRRGMKLDFNSIHSQSSPNTTLLNSKPVDLNGMKSKLGSLSLNDTRSNMNKLRDNATPNGRKNPMNLNLSNLRGGSIPSKNNTNNNPINNNNRPQNTFQTNSFSTYSKYIDVKSGSLNFSGKASLHSKGIDFSNGSSFRISMDDLEILEELGHGNYGVVSKVLHKPTNVVMAMKEVRLELDDSKFSQILMELEVLHRCHSDCIVEFYGAFFVEGAVYMCMEFMKGGSIDKIYGNGIPEIPLAYITKRVVQGLKILKDEQNIIHRDVKPTNMLVNENGIVKLCDFGVSGNLVASLARTNIGCQSYMAPERIKHSNLDVNTYSVQSDVWSLGLSILEIAKGCYPYPPETYNNVFSQLSAIVDGEAPELPKEKFSNDAQDFVRRCLHKNPNKRPTYSQMLMHPWLSKYSDFEGESLLKDIVNSEIERRESGKSTSDSTTKIVPPLHSGLQT